MYKLFFIVLFATSLNALSITVNSGKSDGKSFSIINLQGEKKPFICTAKKNEFFEIVRIFCSFPHSPQKRISRVSNTFFEIDNIEENERYYIDIKPRHKAKLYPVPYALNDTYLASDKKIAVSRQWMIIGFKEEIDIIRSHSHIESAINFPIEVKSQKFPMIDALDVYGKPIFYKEVEDVADYVSMKKKFKEERYDEVIEDATKAIKKYPKTIFSSEFILYKIRAFYKKSDESETVSLGKIFIREFSSDENMAEVLLYIAHSYSKIGSLADASYFFDRLLSEYPNSLYGSFALVYVGDQYIGNGNSAKGVEYYKKALYSTQNIRVASLAAYRLGKHFLINGKAKQAVHYIDKILEANPEFFLKNIEKSIELADSLAEQMKYYSAARIAEVVLNNVEKIDNYYEPALRKAAVWFDESDRDAVAYRLYDEYLKEFRYGEHGQMIQKMQDGVFFKVNEMNVSEQKEHYDSLVADYEDDEIGQKALFKKAQVLHDNGEHERVHLMKEALKSSSILQSEIDGLLAKNAKKLAISALKSESCIRASEILEEYQIALDNSYNRREFECFFGNGKYEKALKVSGANLKEKNISKRVEWFYWHTKALIKLGEYSQALKIADDLVVLAKIEKLNKFLDIYYDMFNVYDRLGKEKSMILIIEEIEKEFGITFKNLQPYNRLLQVASKRNDNLMALTYAQKAVKLQERAKSFPLTPSLEFAYIQTLKKNSMDDKAFEVAKTLTTKELKDEQKARAFYTLGSMQQPTNPDEAKKSFQISRDAKPESAWGKLSADALKILN